MITGKVHSKLELRASHVIWQPKKESAEFCAILSEDSYHKACNYYSFQQTRYSLIASINYASELPLSRLHPSTLSPDAWGKRQFLEPGGSLGTRRLIYVAYGIPKVEVIFTFKCEITEIIKKIIESQPPALGC